VALLRNSGGIVAAPIGGAEVCPFGIDEVGLSDAASCARDAEIVRTNTATDANN
jgi:hypothetical protein